MTSLAVLSHRTFLHGEIAKFKGMFKVAHFDQSAVLPANWELWRNMATRYHLYEISSFDWRPATIEELENSELHHHST